MTQDFDQLELEDQNNSEQSDEFAEYWNDYGLPASAVLNFRYADRNGDESQRTVDVRLFADTPYGPMLYGYCRLRAADRSFKIDKIRQCIDSSTGNPIANVYDHLNALYEKSPDFSLNTVANKHIDTIRAALHVAVSAGLNRREQAKIIQLICQKTSGDSRISEELVAPFTSGLSNSIEPGLNQTFKLITGRLNKQHPTQGRETILKLCSKISRLQGTPSSDCEDLLGYMSKRFAEKG